MKYDFDDPKIETKFKELANLIEKLDLDLEASDIYSYKNIIEFSRKYLNSNLQLVEFDLLCFAQIAYGWMPTMLTINQNHMREATYIANELLKGKSLELAEVQFLKKTFNNSLVGTSKILHFLMPERFAIWDSKVFFYLFEKKASSHPMANGQIYLNYLARLSTLNQLIDTDLLRKSVSARVGYQLTLPRAAEFIMYIAGKQAEKSKLPNDQIDQAS